MSLSLKHLLYLGIPFAFLAMIHGGTFHEYPQFIHAWANYDYLAIAYGFIENGFDFFHPQTFVFNHQFPDTFRSVQETTITAVDFPIHAYLVSLIMWCFNTDAPAVFYYYNFTYALIGLTFAGLLFQRLTNKFYLGLLGSLFFLSSTVFVYYVHSFLPTITSISNVFIGLYFLHGYHASNHKKHLIWGLFFLTLAGLSRTPFVIPIIAVFGAFLWNFFVQKTKVRFLWLPWLISFSSIAAYFVYNTHLRNTYGSMFLSSPRPPANMDVFSAVVKHVSETWLFDYFSQVVWVIIGLLCLLSGLKLIQSIWKSGIRKIHPLVVFLILYLSGVTCYAFLMTTQFYVHDYYFLDSFFIPLILIAFAGLISLFQVITTRWSNVLSLGLGVLILLSMRAIPNDISHRRQSHDWDVYQSSIETFINNKSWFHDLSLPDSSKVLCLNPYIPNAALSIFKQQGFVVLRTNSENVANALSWNYDYILIQDRLFKQDVYEPYPEIVKHLSLVSKGDGLSLFQYHTDNLSHFNWDDFLPKKHVLFHFKKELQDSIFQHVAYSYSHKKTIKNPYAKSQIQCKAKLSLPDTASSIYWVVDVKNTSNELVFYKASTFSNKDSNKDGQPFHVEVTIPNIPSSDSLLITTYFWNKNQINTEVNHYEVTLSKTP